MPPSLQRQVQFNHIMIRWLDYMIKIIIWYLNVFGTFCMGMSPPKLNSFVALLSESQGHTPKKTNGLLWKPKAETAIGRTSWVVEDGTVGPSSQLDNNVALKFFEMTFLGFTHDLLGFSLFLSYLEWPPFGKHKRHFEEAGRWFFENYWQAQPSSPLGESSPRGLNSGSDWNMD